MANISASELFMYICIAMTNEIEDLIASEVNVLPEFTRGEVTREDVHEAMMNASREPLQTIEALAQIAKKAA